MKIKKKIDAGADATKSNVVKLNSKYTESNVVQNAI